FQVARYDLTKPLVVDPVLIYSSYLGGSGTDVARAVTVDSSGNAYVAGSTDSANFPISAPLQGSLASKPGLDAFVTKFNPSGSAVIFSTFFGGTGDDQANGMALDSGGSVYLAGTTSSSDFPVTKGTVQQTTGTNTDAFVVKLSGDGSTLFYGTYLGGSDSD